MRQALSLIPDNALVGLITFGSLVYGMLFLVSITYYCLLLIIMLHASCTCIMYLHDCETFRACCCHIFVHTHTHTTTNTLQPTQLHTHTTHTHTLHTHTLPQCMSYQPLTCPKHTYFVGIKKLLARRCVSYSVSRQQGPARGPCSLWGAHRVPCRGGGGFCCP